MKDVMNHLLTHANDLSVRIVDEVLRNMNLTIPTWEKEEAVVMYRNLITYLGESLLCTQNSMPDDVVKWSKNNAEREAIRGGDISEIVVRYPTTRVVFADLVTELSLTYKLSVSEAMFLIKRINSILDTSINETVFAFERRREELIKETKIEMAELSAPVVPLLDHTGVLPLIGSIDSYRATYILECVVPKIADLNLNYLIVDCSGILFIDITIAKYLLNIESMLQLLGIKTIVTGIRPELAKTLVEEGIRMLDVWKFATVKQALEKIKEKDLI